MTHKIAPSVLAANFGNLTADLEMVNASAADWFHFDVMDGRFVPNISFGFPILEAVKRVATKPIDVHLMIVEPKNILNNSENQARTISSFTSKPVQICIERYNKSTIWGQKQALPSIRIRPLPCSKTFWKTLICSV